MIRLVLLVLLRVFVVIWIIMPFSIIIFPIGVLLGITDLGTWGDFIVDVWNLEFLGVTQ